MAGIIHKQINLKKTSAGTYSIGWHQDWAIGLCMFIDVLISSPVTAKESKTKILMSLVFLM